MITATNTFLRETRRKHVGLVRLGNFRNNDAKPPRLQDEDIIYECAMRSGGFA